MADGMKKIRSPRSTSSARDAELASPVLPPRAPNRDPVCADCQSKTQEAQNARFAYGGQNHVVSVWKG